MNWIVFVAFIDFLKIKQIKSSTIFQGLFLRKLFFFESGKCETFQIVSVLWQFLSAMVLRHTPKKILLKNSSKKIQNPKCKRAALYTNLLI